MNFRTIVFTTLFLPLLSACLLAVASPEPPVLLSTQAPVLVPTEAATEPPPATQGPVSEPTFMPGTAGWVEYRDPRYGYGLALPCYWTVTPTPMEGTFATMSARSYSDEFFAAHSDRGVWTGDAWPAGAYKLDAVIFEGIDPSLSMQDAIHYTYATYSNEQELVSVEEKTYDRHLGYIATVQGGPQGGETLRVVYFAIGPDALLSLVFYPEAALDEPDLQAMLGSFASALDEPVAFPAQAPSGPPDGSAIACQ